MNHEQFLRFNESLPASQPRLLRGPTGIGKSAAVSSFATATKRILIKLDLTTKEPPDIEGQPFIKDGKTHYATPYWWPTGSNTILLLDEIDRCSEAMQPVAMGLTLDRTAGENVLPESTIIFATANGEKFLTNHLDQALIRRFALIDYRPTVDEWLSWAHSQNLFPDVVNYIAQNRGSLDTPEELIGKPGIQIPCRSTWADLANWLGSIPSENQAGFLKEMEIFGVPFIGLKAAKEFSNWIGTSSSGLLAEGIFDGSARTKKFTVVQIAHVASAVAEQILKRNPKEQTNALVFFAEAGKEQMAGFMARLPKGAGELFQRSKFAMGIADSVVGSIL